MTKDEALKTIREVCPPGATIYCVPRKITAAATVISLYALYTREHEPEIKDVTGLAARILGDGSPEGIRVKGIGLERGLHLVDRLSKAVWGVSANDALYVHQISDEHRSAVVQWARENGQNVCDGVRGFKREWL